jgi:hypothetical protein
MECRNAGTTKEQKTGHDLRPGDTVLPQDGFVVTYIFVAHNDYGRLVARFRTEDAVGYPAE